MAALNNNMNYHNYNNNGPTAINLERVANLPTTQLATQEMSRDSSVTDLVWMNVYWTSALSGQLTVITDHVCWSRVNSTVDWLCSGWFGLRKEFCPWMLDTCPVLQEYGNISYKVHDASASVRSARQAMRDTDAVAIPTPNSADQSGRDSSSHKRGHGSSRSKRHGKMSTSDDIPKYILPIVSIDVPDWCLMFAIAGFTAISVFVDVYPSCVPGICFGRYEFFHVSS